DGLELRGRQRRARGVLGDDADPLAPAERHADAAARRGHRGLRLPAVVERLGERHGHRHTNQAKACHSRLLKVSAGSAPGIVNRIGAGTLSEQALPHGAAGAAERTWSSYWALNRLVR